MTELIQVESSNIESIGYDEFFKYLLVKFVSQKMYSYADVPQEIWEGLLEAPSKGKYLNTVIKGKFEYHTVDPDTAVVEYFMNAARQKWEKENPGKWICDGCQTVYPQITTCEACWVEGVHASHEHVHEGEPVPFNNRTQLGTLQDVLDAPPLSEEHKEFIKEKSEECGVEVKIGKEAETSPVVYDPVCSCGQKMSEVRPGRWGCLDCNSLDTIS